MEKLKKVLYRSQKNRVIAGVCGGIAEYYNIKLANFIRLIFIFGVLFFGGMSIPIYIILIFIIPEKGAENSKSLFNLLNKFGFGNQYFIKNKPIIKTENTIFSSQKKLAYKAESIEINKSQNKSGIDFDLRSKLIIIAIIILIVFVLWKIGIIQFDFNMVWNKFETINF